MSILFIICIFYVLECLTSTHFVFVVLWNLYSIFAELIHHIGAVLNSQVSVCELTLYKIN